MKVLIRTLVILIIFLMTVHGSFSKSKNREIKDEEIKKNLPLITCAVCRAMIDEVNYTISQVDSKKMIEVGGHRKVPYARSDIHLNQIFDELCDKKFSRFALSKNIHGRQSIIRTYARYGKLDIDNLDLSADGHRAIAAACEKLVEGYEEKLIYLFKTERQKEEMEVNVCVGMTKFCKHTDLDDPIPVPEAKKPRDEL